MDEPARLSIAGAVGIHHHELRTQLQRLVERHRGTHAERAGLVRSAHHHGPARASRHRHRDPAELDVVPLVHGGVEGVEVYVEDGARPILGSGHLGVPASLPQQLVAYFCFVRSFWRLGGGRTQRRDDVGEDVCDLRSHGVKHGADGDRHQYQNSHEPQNEADRQPDPGS
jgi:hypothetical protein